MKSFVEIDNEQSGNYLKLLSAVSKLSGLFSESATPFINYRVAENIFCKSFNATNLSRSDTAFDANYNSIGVGLKTFIVNSTTSSEKVAEFNSLSRELSKYKGKELATKVCQENRKALMTNPNTALSNWLLGNILQLEEGELATMEKLDNLGFDSVMVIKDSEGNYSIDIMKTDSYAAFTAEE